MAKRDKRYTIEHGRPLYGVCLQFNRDDSWHVYIIHIQHIFGLVTSHDDYRYIGQEPDTVKLLVEGITGTEGIVTAGNISHKLEEAILLRDELVKRERELFPDKVLMVDDSYLL